MSDEFFQASFGGSKRLGDFGEVRKYHHPKEMLEALAKLPSEERNRVGAIVITQHFVQEGHRRILESDEAAMDASLEESFAKQIRSEMHWEENNPPPIYLVTTIGTHANPDMFVGSNYTYNDFWDGDSILVEDVAKAIRQKPEEHALTESVGEPLSKSPAKERSLTEY